MCHCAVRGFVENLAKQAICFEILKRMQHGHRLIEFRANGFIAGILEVDLDDINILSYDDGRNCQADNDE